jgi:hypothetical protein
MGQVVSCISQINKENIMKMKEQKRKWDESRSPQWRFFQENERKERKGEKRLDNGIWI